MLGFAICLVLGRTLLWKVFAAGNDDAGFLHSILASLLHREKEAYRDIKDRCTLRANENPVAKRPLGVVGVNAQLIVGRYHDRWRCWWRCRRGGG